MPSNPFSNDTEDTSFEQGSPITQAVKNVSKAAVQQASDQSKATAKAIVDQLYGVSTPSSQENGHDHGSPSSSATDSDSAHIPQQRSGDDGNAQSPEDLAQMGKIRHELGSYTSQFKSATNRAGQGVTTDLDQEMEKARQEREQREKQREQDQEAEEQQRREEKESQKDSLAMPAGKKTGMQMGRKQQAPIELERAKTRTESNRGTTG